MFDRIITKQPVLLSSSSFACVSSFVNYGRNQPRGCTWDVVNAWHGALAPNAEGSLPGGMVLRRLFGYYVTGGVFRRYPVPFRTVLTAFT